MEETRTDQTFWRITMTIRQVKSVHEDGSIVVSAKCKIRRFGEDELYFKVDENYQDFINFDASAFVMALLIPAMKLGEDLIVDGSISKKFYEGLEPAMKRLASWNLGLSPINVTVKQLTEDKGDPKSVGLFFSGGVDSFYTYLENKKKIKNISHFILVKGYDIDLWNQKLWDETLKTINEVASKEGIKVVCVESNLLRLIEPIMSWGYSFIGGFGAIALLLRGGFKEVYRAASYKQIANQTSLMLDMIIDEYIKTETTALCLDGTEATRLEKVKKISDDELVLEHLRVCYLNKNGVYNCGECDKCLRTMIALKIVNKLDRAKTFPNEINMNSLRKPFIENEYTAIFHQENLDELEKLNLDPELQEAIKSGLENVTLESSNLFHLVNKFIYLDHMYNMGRFFNSVSTSKRRILNYFSRPNI